MGVPGALVLGFIGCPTLKRDEVDFQAMDACGRKTGFSGKLGRAPGDRVRTRETYVERP